jgi:hypothetical protein
VLEIAEDLDGSLRTSNIREIAEDLDGSLRTSGGDMGDRGGSRWTAEDLEDTVSTIYAILRTISTRTQSTS